MKTIPEEENIDRIVSWLEDLPIASGSEQDKIEPATPPPKTLSHEQSLEEISPTDTNFSGASVFDKPYRRAILLGSPGPYHNDFSDATSADGQDREPIQQPIFQNPRSPIHPTDVTDPQARLTTILSCIQCTLANLPCSRTLPVCTRCTRNATPSCLLQRRLFSEEIDAAPPHLCTKPVLLKLVSETEEVWEAKMEVLGELMEGWNEKRDKENWVCPRVDTEVRRGWLGWVEERRDGGLGGGMGKMNCVELWVEEVKF